LSRSLFRFLFCWVILTAFGSCFSSILSNEPIFLPLCQSGAFRPVAFPLWTPRPLLGLPYLNTFPPVTRLLPPQPTFTRLHKPFPSRIGPTFFFYVCRPFILSPSLCGFFLSYSRAMGFSPCTAYLWTSPDTCSPKSPSSLLCGGRSPSFPPPLSQHLFFRFGRSAVYDGRYLACA